MNRREFFILSGLMSVGTISFPLLLNRDISRHFVNISSLNSFIHTIIIKGDRCSSKSTLAKCLFEYDISALEAMDNPAEYYNLYPRTIFNYLTNSPNITTKFSSRLNVEYNPVIQTGHCLGRCIAGAYIEIGDQDFDIDIDLYNSISRRLQSRFIGRSTYPGRIYIVDNNYQTTPLVTQILDRPGSIVYYI